MGDEITMVDSIPRVLRASVLVMMCAWLMVGVTHDAAANNAPQDEVVNADPVNFTPNILDGHVKAITTVGSRVIVGGTFTQVKQVGDPTTYTRNHLFAFDKNTGALDMDFVPVVDGDVWTLDADPGGTSVFVGGVFANVNGVANFGLTKLNVADGTMTPGFAGSTAGKVRDLVYHDGTVYLGGDMWSVNGTVRNRLAAIDATTGAVDSTFTVGTTLPRVSVDWVSKVDVAPDGSSLVIIGNFLEVDGFPREQIAMIDLTGPQAVVSDWSTERFAPQCSSNFWTYLRDIALSPDSAYFVVATTGAESKNVPDLCDSASRWEAASRGSDLVETWADWTGFDTLTAVAISDVAVYVGGHQKWLNGCEGDSKQCNGAVDRPGIGALDPLNGVPLSWNPGKDRGAAVWDLHLSDDGLYVGSDTDFTAGEYHAKLAQFPLGGGIVPPVPVPATLPTQLYSGESGTNLTVRSFDGSVFGTDETVAGNTINWSQVVGAFVQAGKVYYLDTDGDLKSRTFDGVSMGPEVIEPSWVDWSDATSAAWLDGRLYFTEDNEDELFYRYFSLESGIVSSQTYVASGDGDGLSWDTTRAMGFVDGDLYFADDDGDLISMEMSGVSPVPGSEQLKSGPGLDGRDWAGTDIFFYQPDSSPVVAMTTPVDGAVVTGTSVSLEATASDDFGIDQVEFFVDGVSVGVDGGIQGGWRVDWDSTTSPATTVTVTAEATDTIGQTASDSVTLSVDLAIPDVALTAPMEGATVADTVTISASATDDVGVAQVEFLVDGVTVGVDADGLDGWSVAWDTTTGADGTVTVEAVATDLIGGTASDAVSANVDNTAMGVVAMVVGNPTLSTGDSAVAGRHQMRQRDR